MTDISQSLNLIYALLVILSLISGSMFWLAKLEFNIKSLRNRQGETEEKFKEHIHSNAADHDRLTKEFSEKVDSLRESFAHSEDVWRNIDKSQAVIQKDLSHALEKFQSLEERHSQNLKNIYERVRELELEKK